MLVRSRYRKTYIRNSLKKKAEQESMKKETRRRQEKEVDKEKVINDTEDENAALIV